MVLSIVEVKVLLKEPSKNLGEMHTLKQFFFGGNLILVVAAHCKNGAISISLHFRRTFPFCLNTLSITTKVIDR